MAIKLQTAIGVRIHGQDVIMPAVLVEPNTDIKAVDETLLRTIEDLIKSHIEDALSVFIYHFEAI